MQKLLCLLMCMLLSIDHSIRLVTNAGASGFSVNLIHRDSPLSPFYSTSSNSAQLLRNEALRSISRAKTFRSFIDQKSIQSVMIPDGASYLMKISVGTPPFEFIAIADTGSDLIWLQCDPCKHCYKQDAPLFKPQSSSTYQQIPCTSTLCKVLNVTSSNGTTCGSVNECAYSYSYEDNSFTDGTLSSDTFTFDSSTGRKTAFPMSLFGCGHHEGGAFNSDAAGLVGLGGGPFSLISQLGTQIDHKFSYCLVPRSSNTTSKLRFGSDAVVSQQVGVVSTPLITKSDLTYYYLNLEGISLGNKTAQATSSGGNIIIDSGTTLTLIEPSMYTFLEAAVKEAVGLPSVPDPSKTVDLCFKEASAVNRVNSLEIVFHFTGADITLKPINTFWIMDDLLCMLIVPNPNDGIPTFGNYAQINFQVEYDIQGKTVSFAPANCTAA